MPDSSLPEEINFSAHGLSTYLSNLLNDPTVGEVRSCLYVCVCVCIRYTWMGFQGMSGAAVVCVCVASDRFTLTSKVENAGHR